MYTYTPNSLHPDSSKISIKGVQSLWSVSVRTYDYVDIRVFKWGLVVTIISRVHI